MLQCQHHQIFCPELVGTDLKKKLLTENYKHGCQQSKSPLERVAGRGDSGIQIFTSAHFSIVQSALIVHGAAQSRNFVRGGKRSVYFQPIPPFPIPPLISLAEEHGTPDTKSIGVFFKLVCSLTLPGARCITQSPFSLCLLCVCLLCLTPFVLLRSWDLAEWMHPQFSIFKQKPSFIALFST